MRGPAAWTMRTKCFRFDADEVRVRRNGHAVIPGPVAHDWEWLKEFPDLGHARQIQAPETFHAALLDWLSVGPTAEIDVTKP
jgi:hypothetical protein